MVLRRIDRRRALLAGGGALGALAGVYGLVDGAPASAADLITRSSGSPSTGLNGLDRKGIESAFGIPGRMQEGGVLQVDFPRNDLHASLHGLPVMADFALDSEALFKGMGDRTMMMGELALLESEVSPVIDGLARENLDVTAVHNHLLTTPTVLFVHYMGQGDGVRMAQGLRRALLPTGTPFGQSQPNADVAKLTIDAHKIEQILGQSGQTSGSVFIVSVPRREQITMSGMPVPPSLGVESLIYFQPTGGGQAALQAELVLIASEVNPVLRTLRSRHVEVAAIHNHEMDEQPRLFYMHSFAHGDAVALASIAREALNRTNSA